MLRTRFAVFSAQDEEKCGGDGCGENPHDKPVPGPCAAHGHLRTAAGVRVAQPDNEAVNRHGHGHAQIGQHFPIIAETQGNQAVKQAEHDHQRKAQRVSPGTENQRRHTDQRRGQRQITAAVKDKKGNNDQRGGNGPQGKLPRSQAKSG